MQSFASVALADRVHVLLTISRIGEDSQDIRHPSERICCIAAFARHISTAERSGFIFSDYGRGMIHTCWDLHLLQPPLDFLTLLLVVPLTLARGVFADIVKLQRIHSRIFQCLDHEVACLSQRSEREKSREPRMVPREVMSG